MKSRKAFWGGRRELNPQPQDPQSCALTRLSYAHHELLKAENHDISNAMPVVDEMQSAVLRTPTMKVTQKNDNPKRTLTQTDSPLSTSPKDASVFARRRDGSYAHHEMTRHCNIVSPDE